MRFTPLAVLTAHVESFMGVLDELKPLFPGHYEKLSHHKGRFPLLPRYDVYGRLDAAGELLMVALRCRGRLVGYWTTHVAPGLHYETCLTGTMDMWWIVPEHMSGAGPLILGRAVKRELERRGVSLWFAGEKAHVPCRRLYAALGMQIAELTYMKWLGD